MNKKSGWDDQCDEENTGLHYDPTIACGYLSEQMLPGDSASCTGTHYSGSPLHGHKPHCVKEGNNIKPIKYDCKEQDAGNTCKYGDLSGKLGQLEVQKGENDNLFAKFRGIDKYFVKKSDFKLSDTDYSIVMSKYGARILCAKLMLLCNNS